MPHIFNARTIKQITAPATPLVSLADMKTYLRVDGSDDDDLIEGFVGAATQVVKKYIKRALITETLQVQMDGFWRGNYGEPDSRLLALGPGVHTGAKSYYLQGSQYIDLAFPPLQHINSIVTFDRDNNSSTFSASSYELDGERGRVYLNEGEIWPTNLRSRAAVQVEYDAGYGDNPSDVPAAIVQCVKQTVGKYYDCREVCDLNENTKLMLSGYKIYDNLGFN